MAGACECGSDPLGSIKCGEFFDLLVSEETLCYTWLVS